MDSTARRTGGLLEGLYRLLMRRNSVYVTFIVAGAFAGERAVDYGVKKLWEYNNVGFFGGVDQSRCLTDVPWFMAVLGKSLLWGTEKRYEDIPVLGTRPAEE